MNDKMNIVITSVSALNSGAEISLTVRISEGERSEVRRIVLLAQSFAELRVRKGEIDEEYFDMLVEASDFCLAVKRGMQILGYGACSKKNLILKLRGKGISRETAANAAEYLSEKGYINEENDAVREAEKCLKKYWGKQRIFSALYEKGYGDKAIKEAMDSLEDVDFSDNCAQLIRRKVREIPDDPDDRKKLFAALVRYGYSSSEIKNAFSKI